MGCKRTHEVDRQILLSWVRSVLFAAVLLGWNPGNGPAFARGGTPGVVWLTSSTEHFVVHYPMTRSGYKGPRAIVTARLARRAGTIADHLYAKLATRLDLSDLPDPIHIIIDAQMVSSDQAFAEPEWARIHIPSAPGPEYLLGGQGDWLTETIAHELGHIVLAYRGGALPPGLAGLIELQVGTATWRRHTGDTAMEPVPGTGTAVQARLPLADAAPFFWVEGGAEFLADLAGGDRWGACREMLLRTAFEEGLILSPADLQSSLGKTGLDGDRAYNQGYAFMLFLQERYGEASFDRIVAAARDRFRWRWTEAVEEGQGIGFEELYARWLEWLEQRYEGDDNATSSIVEGQELAQMTPPWRSSDLEVRRRWMALPFEVRRAEREKQGLVAAYPAWSRGGKYLATWESGGLTVRAVDELDWPAFGGRPLEPVRDRLELARRSRRQASLEGVLRYPSSWSPDSKRLVVVAPEHWDPDVRKAADPAEWTALFLVDVVERADRRIQLSPVPPGTPIANTLGARDPAWSPDGTWIAFVRYMDGTANLWVVHPDGTDSRPLTHFADGAQIAHPSWSPDSSRIVFQLFRKGQRDLWTAHVARDELLPIMLDEADDRHPFWAYDGKIYYASDGTGIFNLYSFDPSTLEVRRLTNVRGGAFMPWVTERDNLTFVAFDGYAYKVYGLSAAARLEEPVDNAAFFVDATLARGILQDAQEAPAAAGDRYRALRGFSRAMVIPGLRVSGRMVEAGFRFRWEDPLERHALYLETLAGTGSTVHTHYTFSQFAPRFRIGAWQRIEKESVSVDLEPGPSWNPVDTRREERYRNVYFRLIQDLSSSLRLDIAVDGRDTAFRAEDGTFSPSPLYRSVGGGPRLVFVTFPASPTHGPRGIDPRGGFMATVDYQWRQSRVWDPLTGGLLYDSGEWLGAYDYHRVDAELLAGWALPWAAHTLEWRLNLGAIDRNVGWWDELKAGERAPGPLPRLDPFVPFPGYTEESLSGETLGVLALAYRVPVATGVAQTLGPIYLDSVYLQVGGTVGNVWGFRDEDGQARREDPQSDVSSRNSPPTHPNRILSEAGIEVRVDASLFARYRWGSFLRIGYAFTPVTGVGDVDRDNVYPGLDGDLVPQPGGETYPAGLRISLGIGTGF